MKTYEEGISTKIPEHKMWGVEYFGTPLNSTNFSW